MSTAVLFSFVMRGSPPDSDTQRNNLCRGAGEGSGAAVNWQACFFDVLEVGARRARRIV